MRQDELPAVGVMGLGVMGAPMAGHMLRAGFALHITARRPGQADALVAAWAHASTSGPAVGYAWWTHP